jgi:hypothetical protein
MSRHCNLPFHIYVNVKNSFLGEKMPDGVTSGIWHGIYTREGQILQCHVLLESGANWSGLPLHAISTSNIFEHQQEVVSPWGCMGKEIEAWHCTYLEGLECIMHKPIQSTGRHTGIVIDWSDGFSRYPQEHKPLNLIQLETGQFSLIPNNYATYKDKHFIEENAKAAMKFYKRNEKVYWEV